MGAAAVESLLEGSGLQRKPAALSLLAGLGAKLTRASDLPSSSAPRDPLPTTVDALDRLLLGGLPRGGFVEVSGRRSCGLFSIGIATLAAATSSGETAALVDLGSHLDPQSAEEAGVDLTRVLWVRPAKLKDAVASAEMTLSAGFPLVVLDLGLPPLRGRFVPDAAWVRLERAARQRHAMLLLLAPYRISGVAADAVVAADAMRPVWRAAAPGSPKLLDGVASRLTLQKDARARSGIAEQMGLRVDATLSIPSLPATTGERGTFSSPAQGASDMPVIPRSAATRDPFNSRALTQKGIPRSARDDNDAPRDGNTVPRAAAV
jgi:RecA DNA recombination protein